jgi:hypothetical protein
LWWLALWTWVTDGSSPSAGGGTKGTWKGPVATHDLSCVEAFVGGMDLEPVACPRPARAVEQTPVGLTLRDRRKPLTLPSVAQLRPGEREGGVTLRELQAGKAIGDVRGVCRFVDITQRRQQLHRETEA